MRSKVDIVSLKEVLEKIKYVSLPATISAPNAYKSFDPDRVRISSSASIASSAYHQYNYRYTTYDEILVTAIILQCI